MSNQNEITLNRQASATMYYLSSEGYCILKKPWIYKLGLMTAYALKELMDRYEQERINNRLVKDVWFTFSRKEMEEKWGITDPTQRRILKELADLGVLEIKKSKSLPRCNFYRLDKDALDKLDVIAYEEFDEKVRKNFQSGKELI